MTPEEAATQFARRFYEPVEWAQANGVSAYVVAALCVATVREVTADPRYDHDVM